MSKNTLRLLGVLSVGAAALALRNSKGSGVPNCPDIKIGEDQQLAGVRFQEVMKGGASPGDAVPIVFAFHSKGNSPSQYSKSGSMSAIGPARMIIPYGIYSSQDLNGGSADSYHFFPSGIKNIINNNSESEVLEIFSTTSRWFEPFARAIVRCRPSPPDRRPVFTGSSMGAQMAYLMNSTMPGFAGLTVAVNGYLPRPFWNSNISPQAALHGRSDTTVPYNWDKEYNETIISQGAPATFVPYDAGHGLTKTMSSDWQSFIRNYISGA